jgi:quercetin dioxygenase-like cupin family protein
VVPNHSHTSDELYLWLSGDFTYVAADGAERGLRAPAYISLPGGAAHGLRCGADPCVLFLRYSRPFDLHVHAAPPRR